MGAGRESVGDMNMTMKERLETAINGIRANSKIPALDEAGVRTQVIDRLLERLGWEIFDENEFRREYPVPGGRVDYALLDNGDPKVFIEAKGPTEQLGHHEDQLVTYSAKRGVPLATLTNGLEWWLYLPLQVGSFEARRFCRLDISKMEVTKACDVLIAYLAQENVYSGAAVNKAEAHLKQLQDARRIDEALPRAWKELIDGPDGLLVDLINDKVKGLCGVEAAPERIKGFLVRLGNTSPIAVVSRKVEKKGLAYTRDRHGNSIDLDLSTLARTEDKDLLHAPLSDIIKKYTNVENVQKRNIRAAVKKHMEDRGFIEFEIFTEWGGVKSDRPRLCKVDICTAQHAINRRK